MADALLVVEVGLSVNLRALTIEQVINKRKQMLVDLRPSLVSELRQSLVGHSSEAATAFLTRELDAHLEAGVLGQRSDWFNDDDNFASALRLMLKAKRDFLEVGPLRYAAVSRLDEEAFEPLLLSAGRRSAFVSDVLFAY